ncbi:cupin domain-containing protein [Paenibacillus pinisoli]|uniref:acireductone dioxygenase (Fe(2+)-requiring) n=1 Tax=Paenibacillus pinisoli TaxID=1276110 RepID=A0A3A6PG68_9BACL|nr:cupin domain-containing protein [Paenibacillus pinisoli]RJX39875.1 cupin domain-containing protein [Paenibacillus pinisoli]
MAKLRIRGTAEPVEGSAIGIFLEEQGVYYERWEGNHTPFAYDDRLLLTEEEKAELLRIYEHRIADFAKRRGYKQWDIVILSDQTPDMLQKFGSLHYHLDDEVRIVLGGGGVFTIKREDGTGYFELTAVAGDVVVVPARRPHAFRLAEQPQFIVVRLFEGEASSVTYKADDPSFHVN